MAGKYQSDNGFGWSAGVKAAGDAVAAVDEELYDGVVDEEVKAGLRRKGFGHFDVDIVDEEGSR